VFSDDFAGAAGTAPSAANWFYDIGTGYGTGEIEHTTSSTSNVYLDGNGHLVLKAVNSGGTWTSGRIESTRDDVQAPPGGKLEMTASIEQPNPASGLGYWPAFWALGSPMRMGGGWPQSGEIDMMEDVNGLNEASQTLHDAANSPGHALIACPGAGSGAGSGCQTGYHTYSVIIDRTNASAETLQFLMDGTVESTITEASVGTTAWQQAIDHGFFIIFDLAIGGAFPAAFGGGPNAATASGGSLNVDYVAVYNKSPNYGTNIAQGKPTTASSAESTQFPASNATDGNITTRWSSTFSDPQWLQVDLGQNYSLNHAVLTWEAATASAYQIQTSTDGNTWSTAYTNNNSPQDIQSAALSATARYVRVYATGRASQWGDSLYELALYGTPTSGGGGAGTLLSQGKTATSSSTENASFAAANAVDGNTGTRWSSAFSDPQWLQVDLGATRTISRVDLNWEAAYASAFQLQSSTDGTTWTNLTPATAGAAGTQSLTVSGSGRYVRMSGTARATQYGYSLWEFQVYGS